MIWCFSKGNSDKKGQLLHTFLNPQASKQPEAPPSLLARRKECNIVHPQTDINEIKHNIN